MQVLMLIQIHCIFLNKLTENIPVFILDMVLCLYKVLIYTSFWNVESDYTDGKTFSVNRVPLGDDDRMING